MSQANVFLALYVVCCTLCSVVGFFYVGKEFFLNSFFDIALVGVSGPILVRMILKYMSK